jgi:membrane protease subunit (stomatin/prohibitin family)
MVIVENGRIVEFCAEAGRYTYDASTQPSVFSGNNHGLKALGKEILNQRAAGGQRFSTQRVFFINLGELIHAPIKWGCGDIAFHHTQQYATGLMELDITLKGNGQATIRIVDPIKFFKTIGAQVVGTDGDGIVSINDSGIMSNLKANIVDNVAVAIETLGTEQAVAYTGIRSKGNDIKNIINRLISDEWSGSRGFELASFSVNGSFRPSDADMEQMRQMQQSFTMAQNANMMNYDIQKGVSEGFRAAGEQGSFGNAANSAILMGAGMGGGFGNIQQQPVQQPQPVKKAVPDNSWTCACGNKNELMFCTNCGSKKPVNGHQDAPKGSWKCSCENVNYIGDKFCSNCGAKKPVVKKLVCDKCGWEPAPGAKVKFCPKCGDIFNDDDLVEVN